tara:strand:- start:17787 stop:18041 length:255 start_codon:yes stop_codon:yes gene_type:complete
MRCKSCDSILQPSEIIWREETKEHEELCRKCREIISSQCPDSDTIHSQDIEESYTESIDSLTDLYENDTYSQLLNLNKESSDEY